MQETARGLGLSVFYLRKGCKEGRIPHIRVGCEYRVDVQALMEQLHREAQENVKAGGGI